MDVIAALTRWADDQEGKAICWLSGPAGYGKSAISHAIAKHYDEKRRLVGNFFFFRGSGDRSTIKRLVHTLSYQLYHYVEATKDPIHRAIKNTPHVTTISSTDQFRKLIIEPIREAGDVLVQMKPIIVLDALDECDDRDSMKEFIEGIIGIFHDDHRLPLRILITSRVEEHIQDALETSAARSAVHPLSLTDFDARRDIRSFFEGHLSSLYDQKRRVMRGVPRPWPSLRDLDSLVRKSDGSFLFATILITLIGARGTVPQDNLQKALTAEDGLDPLYRQVFADALRDDNFAPVIGTVMLLSEPIPIAFLAHLLRLRSADVVQTLTGVQSVLMIPGRDDQPILLFHTSLRDFLTSPVRSQDYFIHPQVRHLWIAADCLRVITKRPTDDIFYADREEYACLNWCHHLERGVTLGGKDLPRVLEEIRLGDILNNFAAEAMDIWLNTSLFIGHRQLGNLRSAISKIKVGHMFLVFGEVVLTTGAVIGHTKRTASWGNVGKF